MANKKLKLVRVTWEDAYSNASWQFTDEVSKTFDNGPYDVDHVGWLLRDGKDGLVLASRLGNNGRSVGLLQFIPRGMVRKVKKLGY
jgi:hypothetical protein